MSSLLVFPGQGAQQPGMLQHLPQSPQARACLQEASDVLGQDVLTLDSPQALASTRAVQLCLLIAGVAAARTLLQPDTRVNYVAGLSIGAYPAAVVAGALEFADALRLVSLRGELMQQAYPQGYGMTALIGLELAAVEGLLAQVHSPQRPVYLANINADNQVVIAGSDAAMHAVAELARGCGVGVAKRLAVSVPSHCPLLEQPAQALAAAFAEVPLQLPKLGYLSGSRARPMRSVEALRDDLAFNMCRVVDWRGTVQSAYERGVRLQIELPPGAVLTGLARRVFAQGTVIAFDGARLDTLQALLNEEGSRDR
ncbi:MULTISPECIES: malonate decarboxylase subunit epsilon [unclassified Pseudomonas]|uniref:malonate decarboxylase subunit epsilon n=1 Tax=unclassified Pseudomonas TaxID=196821 RepID=UPI000876408B|nr:MULTISPECIES: malonate decarboxylase subunit epsilon [unclassified Pseudomonas]SCZ70879.1 malonate decarboxylase epsilon subunit [Pseudomonas sp. NFPP17]SDA73765.1 malonate decarboxylase epsilon subunit [Pseudomonas sp. NFPP15]SEL28734.1 malonate decarboxylase epsilon subunit [Pseudomonas sp. NFPP18]SFA63872.1 malonate decarboxylase epsilon subunit [Pseudomonas sp. NFPP13]SFT92617.1 malonate decarboxylase epsilon subunit [Pseudomonas sp. NFPP25]